MPTNINIFEGGELIAFDKIPRLPPYRKVFMAYIDILGYKNLIESLKINAPEFFNKIISDIEWSKGFCKHINISLLSDAIVVTSHGLGVKSIYNIIYFFR